MLRHWMSLFMLGVFLIGSAGTARELNRENTPTATIGLPTEVDPRARESGLYLQPRPPAAQAQLTFTVNEPSGVARKNWPVRGGIPMHRGELKDPRQIRLRDDKQQEIPVQGHSTAVWPEGTVKFLCLDFLVDLAAGQTRTFTLKYGTRVRPAVKTNLAAKVTREGVAINTGLMKVNFTPGEIFCTPIKIKGQTVTNGPLTGRLLVSEGQPQKPPTRYALKVDKVELVEQGLVQATVYLKGSYGPPLSRTPYEKQAVRKVPRYVFHGFVRVYAGSARMDVTHTLGYNGDEHQDFIRRYGLVVPLGGENPKLTYGADKGQPQTAAISADTLLAQPHHSNWVLKGAATATGKRFGGWAALQSRKRSVIMGLRHAWQQWPVSFQASAKGELTLDIYGGVDDTFLDPRFIETGKKLNKKTGAGFYKSKSMFVGERFSTVYTGGRGPTGRAMGLCKISELVIDFTPGADPASVGNGHHHMLVPWPGKERFAETHVFGLTGYYHDGDPRLTQIQDFHSILMDFPLAVHEANGYYGWVDYPDAPDCLWPKNGKFDMSIFGGGKGWTNGERAVMGYIGHYVASGWRRALDTGHQMALHTIGIDAEHDGGELQTGNSHRHNQIHWADGGGPRQAGWRGWYYYYWLSGHNEIWRSIQELHWAAFGANPHPGSASWPWDQSNGPFRYKDHKKWQSVWVSASGGTPFHWMNFLRWQTTGEERYVRHIDSLMTFWKHNPYNSKDGKPPRRYNLDLTTGKLAVLPKGHQYAEWNPNDPAQPRYTTYYWKTYGGGSLVATWAQLTGSAKAVDVILSFGDYFAHDKREDMRVDILYSKNRKKGTGGWGIYHSFEGIVPAYALLRQKDYPERVARWHKATADWRLYSYPGWKARIFHGPKYMTTGAKPLHPEEYTADKWHALGVACYDQNGFKIMAATAWTNIYTLWLLRPEAQTARK